MKINELSQRHIVFMDDAVFEGIYLNMHLIIATHRNYLIDTGLGNDYVKVVNDYLKQRNEEKELVVINSHHHWDHIWGNGLFKDNTIVAHTSTYATIKETWHDAIANYPQFMRGDVEYVLPNLLFEDVLQFPEDGIHIEFAPAHSNNDIFIYDEVERVMNVADNLGDSDEELLPGLELQPNDLKKALERYQSFDVDYIVSGHNNIKKGAHFDVMLKALK